MIPSIITIIILYLSLSGAISDEKLAEYEKTSWQVKLDLDMPELIPAAVMWAVFDEDPISDYKHRVEELKDVYSQVLEGEEDKEQLDFLRDIQMRAIWTMLFEKITGDGIYLLTKVRNHSLASTRDGGKKWIVSKLVYIDRKPICWVIPIEVEKGKTVEVVFSNDNTYDITEIYNEVMGK